MKNLARLLSLVLVLGLAGFQAGCASSTQSARRAGKANNFEIVETSAQRPLTAAEMALLKISVAEYLETKGATAKGDYYVKVYLGPDQDGVPADWVIVRFTRNTDLRLSMVAAYPAPGYQSYAAYDYYPYGYDHYSRISFNYYPDPYYGPRYYFPPGHRRHDRDNDHDHGRGRDRDKDRDKDGDKDRDRDTAGTDNRPRFKPIDPVGTPSRVTRNRGDGDSATRSNYQPRPDSSNSSQPERTAAPNRSSGGGFATRSDMHRRDRDSSPRSEPTSYTPPARSESSDRSNSSNSSNSSYSPPSYSRSESSSSSSSSSSSNSSQREANQAAAQRERLE